MSADLQWLIVRNNSAFLLKKRNVKPFNTEPLHLTNKHSLKYSTLVHKNTIGVLPHKDKKGFVVVQKSSRKVQKPRQSLVKTHLKYGPRRALSKLYKVIVGGGYRKDCKTAALKRASALLRADKPRTAKSFKQARKA